MKQKKLMVILVLLLIVSACATTTPIDKCVEESPAGFWYGLWHGVISIFSFIGSLFDDSICVYQVNNTGGWYDFGFLLGAGIISFGSSKASK